MTSNRTERTHPPVNACDVGREAAIEPLVLRATEAARVLGISERSLWSLTKRGEVPHVRFGRVVGYPVDQLRRWLDKRSKGGEPKRRDDARGTT